MSSYLKIAEKAKLKKADSAPSEQHGNHDSRARNDRSWASKEQIPSATKAIKATKDLPGGAFTPFTVSEILREINDPRTGPGKNTELYRRGELSEENAVKWVTCAILWRRGQSFDVWKHHAPAVKKALRLCIHELGPEACAVCFGARRKGMTERKTKQKMQSSE